MAEHAGTVRRREDPRLITGRGEFVDDLPVPDCLHAAMLRSPHAHARLRAIDVSAARRAPGVVGVFTAADLGPAGEPMPIYAPHPALPVPCRIRHVRHLLGDIATHPDRFDAEGGEVHYREALALAEPRGMRPLVAGCHFGLGKLHRRTGKRQEAHEHLATATTMFREMDMRFWLEQAFRCPPVPLSLPFPFRCQIRCPFGNSNDGNALILLALRHHMRVPVMVWVTPGATGTSVRTLQTARILVKTPTRRVGQVLQERKAGAPSRR